MLRVRLKFRIRAAITDGIFGLLIGNWVQYAGRYFAAAAHSLPGGFGGLGYDYNDVWGGLLRPNDVSSADPDGSNQFEEGFYNPLCSVTFGLADRMLYRVTSVTAGRVKTSEIYLNSKSGVAIIAPSAEKEDTKPGSQVARKPSSRGLLALKAFSRWPLVARRINVPTENRMADVSTTVVSQM